jgi:FkbM family methyltransferase
MIYTYTLKAIDKIVEQSKKIKYLNLLLFRRGNKSFSIKLWGKKYSALNGSSFYHNYHEIFTKKLYHFEPKSSDKVFIIDCGSNFGLSIIYFLRNYKKCEILGFEADPIVFESLTQNLKSYDSLNYKVLNYALWDKEGFLNFNNTGDDSGSLVNNSHSDSQLVVKTVLLSNYIKNRQVDFLKIDIEGAELKVIEEIKDCLGLVKNIFIEFHSFVGQKQNLSTIIKILEEKGFRIYIQEQFVSEKPLVKETSYLGMDMMLLIFGKNESFESNV